MSEEQPTEIWQDIPDYPGYQASSQGRIRSFRKRGSPPRILKPSVIPNGYLYVCLQQDGRSVSRYVHRLVLLAFRGKPPAGMTTRHLNNNDRTDNRLENLCWGTFQENEADKRRHWGENRVGLIPNRKLTEAKVVLIRLLHSTGMSRDDLASLFKVSEGAVRAIVKRRSWAYLRGGPKEADLRHNSGIGSNNSFSKLNEADVLEIKHQLSLGRPQCDLAERFGVDRSTISLIARGKRWAHVD